MAREKILIVDDDKTTRAMVMAGLEKAGYQVFEAQSGESGYQIARSVRPHLVISDVVMEQMGGHQLIKKLRESEFGKGMLFIVLTARGQMQDYFELMKVDDFIAKPIDMGDFLKRVEKVLGKLNRD
jgi:sigma-B regulation protein RsbU (phosphoserine phosphatase)